MVYLAPMAQAIQSFVVANPPIGIIVTVAALAGYVIYDEKRKMKNK